MTALTVIGIKCGPNGSKKYEKIEHLCPFFDFLTPWFVLEKHSKILNPSYMTTQVRHLKTKFADHSIDSPQLIVLAKYEFLGFFINENFFGFHQITWHFLHFSKTERFSLLLFSSSLRFPLLQIPKVITMATFLNFTVWHQKQYPIKKIMQHESQCLSKIAKISAVF